MKKHTIEETQNSGDINRRALFGRAASAAATLVVSQSLLSCADSALALDADDDEDAGGTGTASCVLTAVTAAVSEGVQLDLTFNVSRVANSACTPLTGAYLDVWHADAAGVYSDVSGAGAGRRFLRGYQITDADGNARFTTIYPGWYTGSSISGCASPELERTNFGRARARARGASPQREPKRARAGEPAGGGQAKLIARSPAAAQPH